MKEKVAFNIRAAEEEARIAKERAEFEPSSFLPSFTGSPFGFSPSSNVQGELPDLSLVPKVSNLPKFLELMRNTLSFGRRSRPDNISKFDLARAFMEARYPRYSTQVPLNLAYLREGRTGEYQRVPGNPKAGTAWLDESQADWRSLEKSVGTIAHEMRHARQDVKGKLPERFISPEEGFERYRAQPHEIEAREANPVGEEAFRDFSNILTIQDPDSPLTFDFLKRLMAHGWENLPDMVDIIESANAARKIEKAEIAAKMAKTAAVVVPDRPFRVKGTPRR